MSAKSKIILFGYRDYESVPEGKHRARCRFCPVSSSKLVEKKGTTSTFTRHMKKKHPGKWAAYQQVKSSPCPRETNPTGLGVFAAFTCNQTIGKYSAGNIKQKQISDAIVKLIVGCNLPLSHVENDYFRNLLEIAEPKYQPFNRKTLSCKLHAMKAIGKEVIRRMITEQHGSVAITTDIWTDRNCRSFLGVTAHFLGQHPVKKNFELMSVLLSCQRFVGRHTGEAIARALDDIMDDFNVADKIQYIIMDSAANMKQAFSLQLVEPEEDATEEDAELADVADGEIWQELEDEDARAVNEAVTMAARQRISCFAHTLQLVVGDGLRDTWQENCAIAKVTKLASTLHRCAAFKKRFEEKFGRDQTIPAAVNTWWNSTFLQLKALMNLPGIDLHTLTDLCTTDREEYQDMIITRQEWCQIAELVNILGPFAEATNLTQGDKTVTITVVVPLVLDLNSHLKIWETEARHCQTIVRHLHDSLHRRFKGIFIRCLMEGGPTAGSALDEPYFDEIFVMAPVLDPQYMMHWVSEDVQVGDYAETQATRAFLKDMLTELVISEAERLDYERPAEQETAADDLAASGSDDAEPCHKVPHLTTKYKMIQRRIWSEEKETVRSQLSNYLANELGGQDPVVFWKPGGEAHIKYPSLFLLAMQVLPVPATSAPIERVFSKGGLSTEMLETLTFIKCNESFI